MIPEDETPTVFERFQLLFYLESIDQLMRTRRKQKRTLYATDKTLMDAISHMIDMQHEALLNKDD